MTDSCKRWPKYLLERATASPPEGCGVVAGSTPVLFFGNPYARIATISLNPSYKEFLHNDGALLSENRRRLATLPSLGIQRYDQINDQIASKIINECAGYFKQSPLDWFRPLNRILHEGLNVSYYEDTACHLDLVQWATSPAWSGLRDKIQRKLLNNSLEFLIYQLLHGNYRLVIVNGSGVKKEIQFLQWEERTHPSVPSDVKLHECQLGDTQILAWSRHIQKKKELKHIPALTEFVKERYDKFHNERRTT